LIEGGFGLPISTKIKKMANWVDLSGKSSEQGKGRLPKLTGRITPVTDVYSSTTAIDESVDGIDDEEVSIPVDSTDGFPSSGTLLIEAEQVTYTSVTATSFEGCVRGANSTTAAIHADDVVVDEYAKEHTLYDYNSGGVYMLDGTKSEDGVLTVKLPSAKSGIEFKFILKAIGGESAEDIEIVQAAATEDFVGAILDGAGTKDSAVSGDTKIIFDQSGGATVGDWVSLVSDGTNWYVKGTCDAAGGVVFG